MAIRLTFVIPSDVELPADLYEGDRDYHEGWTFERGADAYAFAEKAMAEHPEIVEYTIEKI